MGVFNWNSVKPYLEDDYADIQIAVETGTLFGDSTHEMSKHFAAVHTIELAYPLYLSAVRRFLNTPVHVYFGNSAVVLNVIVPTLAAPTLFYLDAHWSGDNTVDWTRSNWAGYGANIDTAYVGTSPTSIAQVPLAFEFTAIVKKFKHPCVLYVDDMDKFDNNGNGLKDKRFIGEDWTHLTLANLKNILLPRLRTWKLHNNQLIATLTALP